MITLAVKTTHKMTQKLNQFSRKKTSELEGKESPMKWAILVLSVASGVSNVQKY